jgi:DNA modification methylase
VTLPKPYYDHAGIIIYKGDCRQITPFIGQVGLVLTDPPYGGGLSVDYANRFKTHAGKWWNKSDRSGQRRHIPIKGDDKPFDPILLLSIKAQAKILWGANWYASRLPDSGGWWVWDKRMGRRDVSDAEWPMSEAELAWTDIGKGVRIFRHTWFGLIRDSEKGTFYHPTQKPAALMAWCIEKSKTEGVIIDPYMGSGTTLVAAKCLGRKAIGIEEEEIYCEIAVQRLAQEILPL